MLSSDRTQDRRSFDCSLREIQCQRSRTDPRSLVYGLHSGVFSEEMCAKAGHEAIPRLNILCSVLFPVRPRDRSCGLSAALFYSVHGTNMILISCRLRQKAHSTYRATSTWTSFVLHCRPRRQRGDSAFWRSRSPLTSPAVCIAFSLRRVCPSTKTHRPAR
jgi:hypothetical protein